MGAPWVRVAEEEGVTKWEMGAPWVGQQQEDWDPGQ